jgi:pimeloyl-ACP methyl ester carboxylesterase
LLGALCDRLELDTVDVVANDTGGAISQVFAATNPRGIRSLTLTNCDAHDNVPPDAFKVVVDVARAGELAPLVRAMVDDLELARSAAGIGVGFERADTVPDDVIRGWLAPLVDSEERARQFERYVVALAPHDLLAVEADLRALNAPTLIVWGTGDVFFEVSWAYWLRDNIAGARHVVELADAKLFFPEERAAELGQHIRALWSAS